MTPAPASSVQFRESDHTYWYSGAEYPGMTRVLDQMGLYVLSPYAKTDFARKRGKAVHTGSLIVFGGDWDPERTDPRIRGSLLGWRKCIEDFGLELIANEQMVWTHEYRAAGRLDYRCRVTRSEHKGKHVLIDIKNGEPPDGVELQMGGYNHMAVRCHGGRIDECWAVWLRNETEDYRRIPSTNPAAESMALSAIQLWWWKKNKGLL